MELRALKVSELNKYIKKIFTNDPLLYNISVEGEISNFKHHYSGHMYFTLKDENSRLKCVMFKNQNINLNMKLEDGMKVIASGYISVYEKGGTYQLYVKKIKTKGLGELYVQYEKLKKKLEAEGFFKKERKLKIPYLPKKVGVVTSATGAAIKDIITVIKRRMPNTDIYIYPVLVQGVKAGNEICRGLEFFDKKRSVDLIITGRGGGSIEELWAFNEENVARTIYNLKTPVISAVGHETDYTISDFVADLRAPTPSAAGELSVPDYIELRAKLSQYLNRMERTIYLSIKDKKERLEDINRNKLSILPIDKINNRRQELDVLFKDFSNNIKGNINTHRNRLDNLGSKLDALSPLAVISRGYTIALDKKGNSIKSINDVKKDQRINLRLKDGSIEANVLNINDKSEIRGETHG